MALGVPFAFILSAAAPHPAVPPVAIPSATVLACWIAIVRKMTTVLRARVQPCRYLLFEHRNSLSAKMCGQPPKFGCWCYILNYPMSTYPQHPGLFPNLIKWRILHVRQGTSMSHFLAHVCRSLNGHEGPCTGYTCKKAKNARDGPD